MEKQKNKDVSLNLDSRKRKELNDLTNDYFIKQKLWEVGLIILGIIFITITLPLMGYYLFYFFPDMVCNVPNGLFYDDNLNVCYFDGSYLYYLAGGFLILLLLVICGISLFALGFALYCVWVIWVDSNWIKAEKRARKELGLPEKKDEHGGIY